MVLIRPVDPDEEAVKSVIALHLSGMISNSPEGSVHALDRSKLSSDDITMFGAFDGETCVSIGAIKTLSPTAGEIKSMRTHPDYLGHGYGKAILQRIIQEARSLGWTKLSLETGTGPSFDAAHHIYETHGFIPAKAFGDYEATDFNRFFSLAL